MLEPVTKYHKEYYRKDEADKLIKELEGKVASLQGMVRDFCHKRGPYAPAPKGYLTMHDRARLHEDRT